MKKILSFLINVGTLFLMTLTAMAITFFVSGCAGTRGDRPRAGHVQDLSYEVLQVKLPEQIAGSIPFQLRLISSLEHPQPEELAAAAEIAGYLKQIAVGPIRVKEGFLIEKEGVWYLMKNKLMFIDVVPAVQYYVAIDK